MKVENRDQHKWETTELLEEDCDISQLTTPEDISQWEDERTVWSRSAIWEDNEVLEHPEVQEEWTSDE